MQRNPRVGSRIPRTSQATAVGSCGHSWTRRFTVGLREESTWTADLIARVNRDRDIEARTMSEIPCRDCQSKREANENTTDESALLTSLRVAPLPAWVGTNAQVAFASSLRVNMLQQILAEIVDMQNVERLWRPHRPVVMTILQDAIATRWSIAREPITAQLRDELDAVAQTFAVASLGVYRHGAWSLFEPDSDEDLAHVRKTLTVWLLGRDAIETSRKFYLLNDPQASQWISRHRSRHGSRNHLPRVTTLESFLAATIVAQHSGITCLDDAWTMYQELIRPTASFSASLVSQSSDSLEQMLEQHAVMSALQPVEDMEPPF